MQEEARQRLIGALERFGFAPSGEPRVITEEVIRSMIDELRPIVADDVTCAMISADATTPLINEFDGIDGLADAWVDWLATFERLELQSEAELIEQGDYVVALGRQVGKSKIAGVPLENEAAAVWKLNEEGKLIRAEFHLSRESAMRSAGIDASAN